ncbi:Trehalose-6-P synthase/phosphatase complex synthase subunit, partial [Entophlyctis luteolus]
MRSQPLIPVPPNVPADATSPRDSPSPQQPDIPSLNVLHSPPPVIATPAPIATIPTPSTSSGASHASVAELSVGRLIMVSNRLPITVTLIESSGKYQYARSSGGLVAGISGLAARMPFVWVGWPGLAVPTEAQNDVRNDLRDQYDAIPVFMSDELVKGHYVGFCNRIL